ncbi:hypothetical protein TNCV_3220041 [Trichonephila clavipes]|nr:hypothetical protein TNCV_2694121 [Trichonephila clavipes]GFV21802.1 hypothetical protein TNCV_3220041 [Trichonephila clavipes]
MENTLKVVKGLQPLSPYTNLMRGLAARRLFKAPLCHEGTIHLQTSISSPGFGRRPNDTAVCVANHYTGWIRGVDALIHVMLMPIFPFERKFRECGVPNELLSSSLEYGMPKHEVKHFNLMLL